MCSAPKMPKPAAAPAPPPPPPPVPEAPPTSPVLNDVSAARKNEDSTARSKRMGTRALRIDLNVGGGASGSGLNVA